MGSMKYDWLRCKVDFDGAAYANNYARQWVIEDGYSISLPRSNKAHNITIDDTQDWTPIEEDDKTFTECPALSRCIFKCSASRPFTTEDNDRDHDYFESDYVTMYFYFGIYWNDVV